MIKDLLLLPTKYRTLITHDLADYVPKPVIDPIFSTIDALLKPLDQLNQKLSDTSTHSANLSAAYHSFHDQVAKVCDGERFAKSLGQGVTSLGSMVRALQGRIDSTTKTLTILGELGKTVLEKGTNPDGDGERLKKLEGIFATLIPILDTFLKDVQGLPQKLNAVHSTLTNVHSNVQTFFGAAVTISQQCREVEAKVVAADVIRVKCIRIHSIITPFESVLAQLGVRADTPAELQDSIKHAEEHLKVPLSVVFEEILPSIAFFGLDLFLQRYFELSGITNQLVTLTTTLSSDKGPLETNLRDYDKAVSDLIGAVEHLQTTSASAGQLDALWKDLLSLLPKIPDPK